MLDITGFVPRLLSRQKGAAYIFGRFKIIRSLYSAYTNLIQSIRSFKKNKSQRKNSYFESVTVDLAVKSLKKDAIFLNLKLPQKLITEIQEFSQRTPLTQEDGLEDFYYSNVKNGYLPNQRAVVQGIVTNPLACGAIKDLVNDPVLIKIVETYLGYSPKKIRPILKWSFVLELPDKRRMKLRQGNLYHFDVDEIKCLYINFYLSKTDKYSGAHAMIKGSHNKKPLKMLFSYSVQEENLLLQYYGKQNEIIIEGEEGFGFIQDPYCYHRAIPPVKNERLFLQLRFS